MNLPNFFGWWSHSTKFQRIQSENRAAVLSVENLSVSYRGREILQGVTFHIMANTITAIVGPSGVGKSTLLRCINRLVDEEEGFLRKGKIFFRGIDIDSNGMDINRLRRTIGILFQKPVIYPISIFDNVIFAVKHLRLAKRKQFAAIAEAHLKEAFLWEEVKDRLRRSALELSVGQQQRLSIARSLASNPEIILMDEPTSALDVHAVRKIEELILSLKKSRAIILVTHHLEQATSLSDQIVCLYPKPGAGEVLFQGTPKNLADSKALQF